MSLRSFSHAYGESNYHIVLVPKYRRDIFKNIHIARICKMVFQDIANQYGYRILALEVMEDHVHLFKGISARKLFWRFPSLKKKLWGGHLWSKGKFFRSVGAVTSEKVEYYIQESQTGGVFSKTGQTSIENFSA